MIKLDKLFIFIQQLSDNILRVMI